MTTDGCPFCSPEAHRVLARNALAIALWDAFPVSPGHALVVPARHAASWFDLTAGEQGAVMALIDAARRVVDERYHPDGFNIGVNVGHAAGQTVAHAHVHLIPRYAGDCADPRGGVRHVVTARGGEPGAATASTRAVRERAADWGRLMRAATPHDRALVRGGEDPLLPHLEAQLALAHAADIVVAFALHSGVVRLRPALSRLLDRGGRLRVVVGDYLGVTEPQALRALLDIAAAAPQRARVHVFETAGERGRAFHPKAYVFHAGDGSGVAYVGSSNLSESGLGAGVEWSYRVVTSRDREGFRDVVAGFEALLRDAAIRPLDGPWIDRYEAMRPAHPQPGGEEAVSRPAPRPEPHEIQREALEALARTRAEGHRAGLVVMAMGLGKTWLAAFDSERAGARRVLFVAHREEILQQALDTFRLVRPRARLGYYAGRARDPEAEVLFASVQTLGRERHLHRFDPRQFDYIVIDEFHHAAAATYRRVIDHFEPEFLLGLTATPHRTDGADLLALCGENLVYECGLFEGIRRNVLSPFSYFGVPDVVDYRNVPWRSARFDEQALTRAVATRRRAENAFEQWQRHATAAQGRYRRTLGFCCSIRHAEFMTEFFRERGVRAVAVHSGEGSAPRVSSIEALERGALDVVFTVDVFNEGLDVPHVDCLLMLRPTESRVVWLQQFGRGLRRAEGKDRVVVVDYIGNHRSFLVKPAALLQCELRNDELSAALEQVVTRRFGELPPGCEVTYELEAVDILRGLLSPSGRDVLREWYEEFRDIHGIRPRAVEAFHAGLDPRSARRRYGGWPGLVAAAGDLTPELRQLVAERAAGTPGGFLDRLERAPMRTGGEMLVPLAMLAEGCLPGAIPIDRLASRSERLLARYPTLAGALRDAVRRAGSWRSFVAEHLVDAWTRPDTSAAPACFSCDGASVGTRFEVDASARAGFAELARELVEWRLAEYALNPAVQPRPEPEPVPGPARWREYMRAQIPALFGLEFSASRWNQGFVSVGDGMFLLVTLDKSGKPASHRYADRFLAPDLFEWQSQNRHRRDSKVGEAIRHHRERGVEVHLFVRRQAKRDGRAAPFCYCGPVRFEDWHGDAPITVRWRLCEPVPEGLRQALGVPERPDAGR